MKHTLQPGELQTIRSNPAKVKTNIDEIEEFHQDDFDHWLGDWDGDGIANIDDPNPLIPGDTETIDSAELKPQIQSLIAQKNQYIPALKSVMTGLIDTGLAIAVKGRLKTMYSTLGKLIRKRFPFTEKVASQAGERYTTGLTDIAGCMAVLDSQENVEKMVQLIQSGQVGDVWEHEDKYENPAAGYRAHHFIIVAGGVPVEVQVKTKRMSMISAASHSPYKNGVLNGELLLELTDLAWKADMGNAKAAKSLEPYLQDLKALETELTLRENPTEEIAELQASFQDTVGKLALAMQLDKFPRQHREEALELFRGHGQIIGVDFDGLFEAAQKTQKTVDPSVAPDGDRPSEAKFESGFSDTELKNFAPIQMTTAERRKANEAAIQILQKEDRSITAGDVSSLRKYTGAGGLGYSEDEAGSQRGLLNEHYTSYRVVRLIWDKLQKMGVTGGNILEPGAGVGNFAGFLPDREHYRILMVERSAISSRIARLLYPRQVVRHENFADTDLSPYNVTGVVGNVPFGDIKIHSSRDRLASLNPRIHDYFILKSLDALKPGGYLAVITSIGTMDKKDPSIRQAMVQRARFVGAYRLPSTAFKDNADTHVTTDILLFQKYTDHDGDVHPDTGSPLNRLFAFDELSSVTKEQNGQTYQAFYNPYYDQYPAHVLGEHIQGHHVQFFSRMGVKGELTEKVVEHVLTDGLEFPYRLPDELPFYDIPDDGVNLDTGREYHPGNLVFYEDRFYEKQRRFFKPVTVGAKGSAGDGLRGRIRSACLLLDKYDDFVTALAQETEEKQALRAEFKGMLSGHIEAYGLPDEDKDIRAQFRQDHRLYKLTTLVKRDPVGGELVYADIIDADSMFNGNYRPSVDSSENLGELAMFGRSIGESLDMDFYQSTYKGGTATHQELEQALQAHPDFFWNPLASRFEFRYEYLAGNVREKLAVAQENELDKNIEALNEVVPQWIDVYKITVDPQHIFTYLPPAAIAEWITDELGYDKVEIGLVKDKAELGNRFYMKLRKWGRYVAGGDETANDMNQGWGDTPLSKIINTYIQDSTFPLNFYDEDGALLANMTLKAAEEMSGDRGKILIERARKIQRQNNNRMLIQVPKKFNAWVRTKASAGVRQQIENAYNDTYNSFINPVFDGRTLRVRGMSDTFYGVKDFAVYKHNRSVAEKLVWNRRGANCHDVGAGKTLASIITCQVLLQQGSARKPMFVVPGKVQEKWVEEYMMLFPDARILNMKMTASTRHKELTMAQLYNWDAIFIADHSFKSLAMSPQQRRDMFGERVAYFDQMIEDFAELMAEDDAISNQTKKSMQRRLEKMKEEWEAKLRSVADSERLETDIYFDELGVDCLFFDEAHFYKNALGSAKAAKLGISASKPSQRAEDTLQKTKWLFSKIGHKNVFVLTATPVVNSPIEVWHMLNLCAPDLLAKYQIENLDNFINLFVREEEKIVKKTTGEYRSERVVAGYYNLPEMRMIIDEVMDIKSYDQLIGFYRDFPDYLLDEKGSQILDADGNPKALEPKFKRPAAKTRNEIIKPSEIHRLLFDDIILRAGEVLECMKDRACETKDNFLVITGDGSKIATDLRVYDTDFDGINPDTLKLGKLIENVAGAYNTRPNPTPSRVPGDIYGDFFIRENPIEVITSKGVEIVYDGYWVALNDKTGEYEVVDVDGLDKDVHSWEEGIFGTRKEAEKRVIFHTQERIRNRKNRKNPNPYAGKPPHQLIEELQGFGYFAEILAEIQEGESLDGQPPSAGWLKKQIEARRDSMSDGSDEQQEIFDRAIMIVEVLYGRDNPTTGAIRNQIIFCDWISLEGARGGSFHQLIKSELVRAGIPKNQIAIINGAIIGTTKNGSDYFVGNKDDKEALKKDVQDDFNQGLYRIIIGNQSIAEGMNLQKWTTDMHHMDVPYTPSQIQQRNGRGLRQGNQYPDVGIHFYLMADSFDQYRLELVSKKQSWIDDLFFGSGRETVTESEGESLEFEQMVAATNSDPRVKEFFEARSKVKELADRIDNLEGEVQRLEASGKLTGDDITRKQQRMTGAVEREKALQASELPATGRQALSDNLFQVETGYDSRPRNLQVNLSSDAKNIPTFRMKTELDVPENNANGRVYFHLIPDGGSPQRQFYNKRTWSSIKAMASQELGQAFGWSLKEKTGQGRSITGNLGNIIATEEDFYGEHGLDIEAEKAGRRPDGSAYSFKQIKDRIGMFAMENWQAIVSRKLADLFLALEKGWQRTAQSRIDQLDGDLKQSKKTLSELEKALAETRQELQQARQSRQKNDKTVIQLNDVVNEIVKVSYSSRDELYQELNRIAPDYGVQKSITVRQVGKLKAGGSGKKLDSGGGDPAGAVRENKAGGSGKGARAGRRPAVLKTLYEKPLVYAGIVKELEIMAGDGMQRIEAENDDLAMIIDAAGTTIFVFPTSLMKLSSRAFNDEQARQMFEEFHHFPADDQDYELFPPSGEKLIQTGYAERIMYQSDKVIYADDEKGKDNHYFHYFDSRQRPVYKYGDVTIISNVNIDGRGILN